ncbi:MCE family protein [Amycolatopsis acidicola]|uniref:MCE family protein n=1 Tax=Amycolatopsis acidicola TaxID=2596893 RepID=A0A5N0UTX7_9PSEU|nr:MCE family protein [Amycolatopsis acidicola]KAA9153517.1 MCE family protein [Amycolatopsis acidicola]
MTSGRANFAYQALGLVFLAVLAGMGWLAVKIYDKSFSDYVPVTLRADRAGTQLKENADVKVRGIVVGSVRGVTIRPGGVDVDLALDPGKVARIPRDVSARLLPKTLFGQRYVALVLPGQPATSAKLTAGDVIQEDHSESAIELEQALRDLLPVLQAVQPQKLASTLGAVSQALEGRGGTLGQTLVTLKDYLGRLNPELPQLQSVITKFADTVSTYQTAAPDLVDALGDLRSTATTLSRQRTDLQALFADVTDASDDTRKFLDTNSSTVIGLTATSEPVLRLLEKYAPEFPCLTDAAVQLTPKLDKALGVGTDEPGLHVELKVRPAPANRQAVTTTGGPKCYSSGSPAPMNTPAEQQLIDELLAMAEGTTPDEIPGWSGLLMGPLLRGAEVTLK